MLPGRLIGIFVQPVYFLAFVGVVRGKRLSFKVTPKGGRGGAGSSLAVFRPQVALATVMALGIGSG